MVRVVLAVCIYASSFVAMLTSGCLISHILTAYPNDHFRTFGVVTPAVSETHAQWLPYAPVGLGVAALLSLVVAIYYWRSGKPRDIKTFAVVTVAALNYFLSLFCITTLVVAYFLLPPIANVTS
ncbi:hypothetical protein [Pseudoxanthomonas sp. UTMC 1351]|uniref:hypothetical protein n=1 Tax=Pseudoxanthomonas sp. UTMC 1351 TaxID=2695853 RepID=UPI0034CE9B3D